MLIGIDCPGCCGGVMLNASPLTVPLLNSDVPTCLQRAGNRAALMAQDQRSRNDPDRSNSLIFHVSSNLRPVLDAVPGAHRPTAGRAVVVAQIDLCPSINRLVTRVLRSNRSPRYSCWQSFPLRSNPSDRRRQRSGGANRQARNASSRVSPFDRFQRWPRSPRCSWSPPD